MNTFNPDLIIEATSVCNRFCSGCYAPNVVSTKSARELLEKRPKLFMDISSLKRTIALWEYDLPEKVSIRGGEPSLHPHLGQIIEALRFFCRETVLETHGRWLLEKNRSQYADLIGAISSLKVIVKISFDSMHGLQVDELREMTSFMNEMNIPFLIAITEQNMEMFWKTKSLAPWINDELFVFQAKSMSTDALVRPSLGVIGVDGSLKGRLTTKFDREQSVIQGIG